MFAVSTVAVTSCYESEFLPAVCPYDEAEVQEVLKNDLTMRFNQNYKVKTFEVPAEVLSAFGGSLENVAFYASYAENSYWCGEDWYTAEYGFYMTSEGYACQRSAEDARYFVEYYPAGTNGYETAVVAVGMLPEKEYEESAPVTLHVGFTSTTIKKPVDINVNILEPLPWAKSMEHEDGLTYTVYESLSPNYTALEVKANEKALCEALGVTMKELVAAMSAESAFETTCVGLNADGSDSTLGKYTANNGYWYDADANVASWSGEISGVFIEWGNSSPLIFRIGQGPGAMEIGHRLDPKIAFRYGGNEAILTFKIQIVEEVTDDLDLL